MNKFTGKNIGFIDRLIRLILGIVLISTGVWSANPVMVILGLFTVYEAVSSWCVLYALLGRNTCPLKQKNSIFHLAFLNGLVILVTAIIINLAAQMAGLETWYDFLKKVFVIGFFPALKTINPLSSAFLFFLYPFILGYVSHEFLRRSMK